MIELKIENFIENADLSGMVLNLIKSNEKIVEIDKGENPKVILAVHNTLTAIQRLNKFYLDEKLANKVSNEDKKEILKLLIVSHQSLLKVQSKLSVSTSEKDNKIKEILLTIINELSAIYPLFLVSEIISEELPLN